MIIWDMIDMSWKNKRHVPNHQPVIYEKHMVKHDFFDDHMGYDRYVMEK